MGATVEDVHHRHRQQVRRRAADVAEQRQAGGVGGGAGDGEADAEDRVGAQARLVRRAVEVDQPLVDQPLLAGLEADELGADDVEDAVDGLGDALAAVALTAVAQLHRLEGAGGGAAGHGGPGDRPVVEGDLDLNGGVSARVEDLPRAYGIDAGHGGSLTSHAPATGTPSRHGPKALRPGSRRRRRRPDAWRKGVPHDHRSDRRPSAPAGAPAAEAVTRPRRPAPRRSAADRRASVEAQRRGWSDGEVPAVAAARREGGLPEQFGYAQGGHLRRARCSSCGGGPASARCSPPGRRSSPAPWRTTACSVHERGRRLPGAAPAAAGGARRLAARRTSASWPSGGVAGVVPLVVGGVCCTGAARGTCAPPAGGWPWSWPASPSSASSSTSSTP